MGKSDVPKAPPGAHGKRVTLKTLATQLGLSISTISRALKGAPDIGSDTIELVRKAAREFGYTPDLRGVKLRTGQTFTLCYLKGIHPRQDVPDVAVAAQINAMTSYLRDSPYQLQMVTWHPGRDDPLRMLTRIVSAGLADGVFLDMTEPQDKRVLYLLENNFPFVTFGRTELFTEHPYVDANSEKAAYDATHYLLARGHRRIALMGSPLAYTFNLQRRRGYLRALAEAGIAPAPELIREDGQSAELARQAVAAMLVEEDPPSGFVCVNEASSLGAMAGVRDRGKQVGVDCDVVSRACTAMSEYLNPPLATCFLDVDDLAKSFCEFLLRRIEGEPVAALQKVFDCELRVPAGGAIARAIGKDAGS